MQSVFVVKTGEGWSLPYTSAHSHRRLKHLHVRVHVYGQGVAEIDNVSNAQAGVMVGAEASGRRFG